MRTVKVAVKKLASEEGSTFPPSTTTHDLRHHYASVLPAGGESVVAVAGISATTTPAWS
ncbi:hypothetical protein LWC35_32810 [Pseudonocardia kujensis]|uniref:hypothetical protein n=1 Tax=Pseudonocardia kujensis TaxID=1128675 RepID=UPI001E3B0B3F|nr:hypothetical protein [Pseudonocardia kujensis]MCE0767642.1 hypothetical protein [Pseudonocardia kujensis]